MNATITDRDEEDLERQITPRWIRRRSVALSGCLVLIAALLGMLYLASLHAVAGNADGATVVLEGQSMQSGNILLHGWSLSLDSFWSIDVPFYAAAVALVGVHAYLLNTIPVVIAAIVIVLAMVLVREDQRGQAALSGALLTLVVLALPNPDLAFYLLQGPLHVATTLWCLVAFLAIRRSRFDWRWCLAVVLLGTGMLGDLQVLALGVLPVLLAGLVAMLRCRNLRSGMSYVAAAIAAPAVGVMVRAIARTIGTYSFGSTHSSATSSLLLANLQHIASRGWQLLGGEVVPIWAMTHEPPAVIIARDVALVVLVVAVCAYALDMIRGAINGRAIASERSWRLEDMLVFAFFADLAVFVVLAATKGNYSRYLPAAVVFASILGGRFTARLASKIRPSAALLAVGFLALIILYGFVRDLGLPTAPAPMSAVASFLQLHHLRQGIADYPSSSILTVETSDAIRLRPVIEGSGRRLVRFERQSDSAWYVGERFSYLVFNVEHPWRGVNAVTASTTFGSGYRSYRVGAFEILVWPKAFSVSPNGSTGVSAS